MALVRIPEENRTISEIRRAVTRISPTAASNTSVRSRTCRSRQARQPRTLLAAYTPKIDELKARGGYVTADVIDVKPDTPGLDAMLAKFSTEHWHDEDEVRFIVEGRGLFHIHPPDRPVFAIEVEARRSDPRAARHACTGSTSAAIAASARSGCSRTSPAGRRTTPRAAWTRTFSRSASARRTSRRAGAGR